MANQNITDEINDRDETTIFDFSQVDEIFDGEHILLEDDITADDKLWSAIGYLLPIFAIVALMQGDKKERPFIKYHAVQAMALTIVLWVLILIVSLATLLFGSFCAPFIWLVTLWPAFDSYKGSYTRIPYVTSFIKKRGWLSSE